MCAYMYIYIYLYLVGDLGEDWSIVIDVKHSNSDLPGGLVEGVGCPNCQRVLCQLLVVQGLCESDHARVPVDCKGAVGASVVREAVGDSRAQVHVVCSHLGDHVASWQV